MGPENVDRKTSRSNMDQNYPRNPYRPTKQSSKHGHMGDDQPAANEIQNSPATRDQASSKVDCSPQESPFSKSMTNSYRSELRQYKRMMSDGDYGSDDDARLDYKDDRANARLRNKEQREARQKQKLAAAEAPPQPSQEGPRGSGSRGNKRDKPGSAKSAKKSWSSSKPKKTMSLSEMKEGMHDVVKQVPTVMWLPPVVQNSDGEEEEGDDKAEEDLECDGHRRRLFFSVVQATETKSQEELLIYSAVEGGDDEFIYNCNLCSTSFQCEVCALVQCLTRP